MVATCSLLDVVEAVGLGIAAPAAFDEVDTKFCDPCTAAVPVAGSTLLDAVLRA